MSPIRGDVGDAFPSRRVAGGDTCPEVTSSFKNDSQRCWPERGRPFAGTCGRRQL